MKRVMIAAAACLFVCSILLSTHLARYYGENHTQQEHFEALRQIVVFPDRLNPSQEEGQPDIRILRNLNSDCVGWIRIPGTGIDYPVMQSAKKPEFYLKHDFDGEESSHGVPFADVRCSIGKSENLILYGHQMHDGSMFSPLLYYEDGDFLREHPDIELFLLDKKHTYQVFAVLREGGTVRPENGWSIFHSIDLTPSGFEEFVSNCRKGSIVPTDLEPAYGGSFLTLVTCEYSQDNGRLAVVAYEKSD